MANWLCPCIGPINMENTVPSLYLKPVLLSMCAFLCQPEEDGRYFVHQKLGVYLSGGPRHFY